MDIQNYPKSLFGKRNSNFDRYDFLAWVRFPGFFLFTFLFNLTQLELRTIPIQKLC
jgi:hypothetical protein